MDQHHATHYALILVNVCLLLSECNKLKKNPECVCFQQNAVALLYIALGREYPPSTTFHPLLKEFINLGFQIKGEFLCQK